MLENNTNQAPKPVQQVQQSSRPNESGQLSIMGFVKIHDPNTKQVYVEKRA